MYQMYAHAVTAIFSFHIVQAKEKENNVQFYLSEMIITNNKIY